MDNLEEETWEEKLASRLPYLSHRNWIVVADAAYPWQTAVGVETICTGASQIEVLTSTLAAVDQVRHVRPTVYLDAELPFLIEADAEGISAYCAEIEPLLAGRIVRRLPHDEIIGKLDAAGRAFRVLLLKTTFLLPYTSIFLELDCGYWSSDAEQRLRKAFAS